MEVSAQKQNREDSNAYKSINKDAVKSPSPLSIGSVDLRQVTSGAPTSNSLQTNPLLADDSDTIEDEWVAIVQRILEEYKDDPYALTQAMAMLRADYLKKRYGKDVKISD